MPAISNFIKAQKSKYVQARKWLPVFYNVDEADKHLCHPDIELLQLAEKVCKYLYRGATFETAAKWLSYHATEIIEKRKAKDPEYKPDLLYTLSTPGMKVFYRKWMAQKTDTIRSSKIKNLKKTKKDLNERFGNTVETVGFTLPDSQGEEVQAEKISA